MRTYRKMLLPLALAAALAACDEERTCASDQLLCGDACVKVASDPGNCGACGNACDAGQKCSGGLCRCADGRADCGGACVDVRSDPAHCGGCATVCAGESVCTTDGAGFTACQGACALPTQTACGRACVDLRSDPDHCGGCGIACAAGSVCTTDGAGATSCQDACALPTQTACGRACVDVRSDSAHCGACGRACGKGEHCEAGACAADLYLACYSSDEVVEGTRDLRRGGSIPVAPGPMAFATLGDTLYLASSDYTAVETLSAIRRDPPAVRVDVLRELSAPRQDIQALEVHDGLLYVSHASVGTLLVLTPGGAVVDELPLVPAGAPAGTPNPNPNGIAFAGDDAYVALNERNEVVVLDVSAMPACARGEASPPCATEVARIDVQPLASPGAFARPSRLATVGGRVYAALVNLDAQWNPPPGSSGRLAAIDAAKRALDTTVVTGDVAGLVDLGAGCLDPAGLALNGQTLWVTCGDFDYSAYPKVAIVGGGVVPVDVSGATPVPGAVLPAGPGEAPGNLAFCGGTGYVGDRNSGRVFRLDPAAGIVDGTELCPISDNYAYVSDLACGF